MEKISPKFISDLFLRKFEERNYKFSRKVWWYRYSLSFDLLPVITRDDFIHDFIHNDAFFVFDHSMDPLFQHNFKTVAKDLINLFTQHGIDLRRIIILSPVPSKFFYKAFYTQNYVTLYPPKLDTKTFFHISYNHLWEEFKNMYKKASIAYLPKTPDKHFLSINRRDSLNRRFLNYSLHRSNLFDFGYVSHQRVVENEIYKRKAEHAQEIKLLATRQDFDVKYFLEYGYKKHYLDTVLSKPDSVFSFTFHRDLSAKSCFEIVTETDICDSLFLTEKTLKPILFKSPFLLCGSYLSLYRLKSFGFQTYDLVFDESYDSEPVYYDRMTIILDNIKRLCSMSVEECHKKMNTVKEVSDYNYNHFLNSDWSFNLTNNIQKRIDEVINV